MPKKRYIFGVILAVELASLPVAAQMVQNAVFTNRAYVTAVEVPSTESGLSRFLVVSNGPFTMRSENMIGDIDISIHQSGDINGKRFGDNAQLPGAGHICAMVANSDETIIYQAERKTAVAKGAHPPPPPWFLPPP